MLAIPINQIEDIFYQSNRALEYLSPENLPIRTNALWSLGFAHQLKGDRISAEEDLKQVLLISEASGNLMISIASLTNLGQLYLADQQLIHAKNTFEQVLNLAGDPPLPFACEALLGLAQIFYEWNQLEKAQTYNKQSLQLALKLENVDTPIMCHLLFARLKIAHNDMQAAAEFIQNAQQFAIQNKISHLIQYIVKGKALLFLKQNNITQALKLAQQNSLPLIMARIHIYQKDGASALNILNPLYDDFKAKNWMQELFEVLLLQSFSYYILQDDSKAANTFEKALNMAAPSKLLRSFIDEGSPFKELLKSISTTIDMNDYLEEILITIHEVENKNESVVENNKKHNSILSPRELEVLQLIAQGYSNIEIGESLFLALNTIKGINRKLFQKLNAKNRTEAVLNARKLELL
jgi:LuxR family maltose regulon positive regulatory protein